MDSDGLQAALNALIFEIFQQTTMTSYQQKITFGEMRRAAHEDDAEDAA